MDNNTKMIEVGELTLVMGLLDSVRTIVDDMQQDYFEFLSPEEDLASIAYDFPRQRAMLNAAGAMLRNIEEDLKNLGASTGYC